MIILCISFCWDLGDSAGVVHRSRIDGWLGVRVSVKVIIALALSSRFPIKIEGVNAPTYFGKWEDAFTKGIPWQAQNKESGKMIL